MRTFFYVAIEISWRIKLIKTNPYGLAKVNSLLLDYSISVGSISGYLEIKDYMATIYMATKVNKSSMQQWWTASLSNTETFSQVQNIPVKW